jgi:hypothetical protein
MKSETGAGMGTGMAITERKQTQLSTRQSPSSLIWLTKALTYLSVGRQGQLSKEMFALYTDKLKEFREDDVQAAIDKILDTPRREGETAIPDIGTLREAVRQARGRRQAGEEKQARDQEFAQLEADRQANPDKYITFEELAAIVLERRRQKGAS